MARYNEIMVGRYARGLQKLFGIKGEVPVASLGGEMIVAHNVFNGAENRYIEAWDRFAWTAALVAGGAGTFNHIRMRNPASTNVVVVIERLRVQITTAPSSYVIRYTVADPGDLGSSLQAEQVLDPRTGPNSKRSMLTLTSETTAAPLLVGQPIDVPLTQTTVPSEWILTDGHEVQLLPGSAVDFINSTVVQDLRVSAIWRQRFLEESERA
jgi:hypothetical protein